MMRRPTSLRWGSDVVAMTGAERRELIRDLLTTAEHPVTGGALAKECGVSRQVIVQDMALLRADGVDVRSTNRGYVIARDTRPRRLYKVRHREDEVADELTMIVDLGGTVEDTLVNHRTYGVVRAQLGVASRRDVQRFVDDLASSRSTLLSGITSGYHFHHVTAPDEATLDEIGRALEQRGWLVEMSPYEREAIS